MERIAVLRGQADKFRALAKTFNDAGARAQAIDLANRCDELADWIEHKAAVVSPLDRPKDGKTEEA